MSAVPPQPTFRDPAGSLTLEADRAVRSIHPNAHAATLEFIRSSFYERMVARGDIVATAVEDSAGGLRLRHPRIEVPTYPWEWTPSQWLAAAELTLDLCEEGIAEGWILKDATPLNILFVDSRPVLVDVLSFERRDPTSTLWLAYGQYIRTFLLPLVMNRLLAWPLALSLFHRDGYEPAELYRTLDWRQRLSRQALWPVTLPSWFESRNAAGAEAPTARHSSGDIAADILQGRIKSLRRRTRRAAATVTASDWSAYEQTRSHYSPAQAEQKLAAAGAILKELSPERVLDIGANAGEYSALAASAGAQVVAVERDAAAAEALYRMSRSRKLAIQTIHADLARPTPAAGWNNAENLALLPRLEGRFDLVMMLAVLHHFLLHDQIPLASIMDLGYSLTRRYLLVEWVPVADPMFQQMMRGRDALYGALSEKELLAACGERFKLLRRDALENGRILFLFEKI